MTIHVGQAIVFGLIGLVQGVILTMSYYDKAQLRSLREPQAHNKHVAKSSVEAK